MTVRASITEDRILIFTKDDDKATFIQRVPQAVTHIAGWADSYLNSIGMQVRGGTGWNPQSSEAIVEPILTELRDTAPWADATVTAEEAAGHIVRTKGGRIMRVDNVSDWDRDPQSVKWVCLSGKFWNDEDEVDGEGWSSWKGTVCAPADELLTITDEPARVSA